MKSPDTNLSESIGDVIIEIEFNIKLVTKLEIDNSIFLLEPTKNHSIPIHEKNMRLNTLLISLAQLLLKYCEKIQ